MAAATYAGVAGVNRKLTKIPVGVSGTNRNCKSAWAGVSGVNRQVFSSGTPLSARAVNSKIKIAVNGVLRNFIILHQGIPDSSIYDASCNGTWVWMETTFDDTITYFSKSGSKNARYAEGRLHAFLNNDFYNALDSKVRGLIKQVKIPYYTAGNVDDPKIGADGLSTKVFALSMQEVKGNRMSDGALLKAFENANTNLLSREDLSAYNYDGERSSYWLRTPYSATRARYVGFSKASGETGPDGYRGEIRQDECDDGHCARPAFILPSTTLTNDNGEIIVA